MHKFPRVVQLIDTLSPGGAERMAVNLANTFSKRGLKSILLVTREMGALQEQLSEPSLAVLLGKQSSLDMLAFRSLLAKVDEFGAEVVHAHGPSVYWGVVLKVLRPSIRLLWHDHLGISPSVIAENPRTEIRWIARWIDSVITANESTREFWLKKGFWSSAQISYLPNFPSLIPYPSSKPSIYTFLHLANYRSEKGHFHVVGASERLLGKNLRFRVRMVGSEVDSSWKRKVEEAIGIAGLTDTISVEGQCNNISKLLSEVDAGLVASDREGLPVALLEYGMAGLPVISSSVGQCASVLENGKLGLIFPPGDIEALAEAMEYLLSNSPKSAHLGTSFGKHVLEKYGDDQFFGGYVKLLQF